MNVIVSNKQKAIIDNANIDAIKDLNGLFNVDDLVNKFKNYFFSKMILDATSVVDFATRDVLQKLSNEIGSDRLIILLPSTPEPPEEFKKLLVELKIYNFSNNIEDVVKFIEKPNTYENAMNTIMNSYNSDNNYYVDSSIKDGEDADFEFENTNDTNSNAGDLEKESNTNVDDYNVNSNSSSLGDIMSQFNVYDDVDNEQLESENDTANDETVQQNINDLSDNIINNQPEISSRSNDSTNTYTFLNMDGFDNIADYNKPKEKHIIGFKNITIHAGSTTLIYMLQKEAIKRNKDVISVEVDKDDFKLFRSSRMISVKNENLATTLDSLREDIVLIDLNDYQDDSLCNEVVYLVEPSVIKLNKLMMMNKEIFTTLKDKKVILNQSMLSTDDIPVLEKEANMKFFFNIGSINDRLDNPIISELFDKITND